jgi:hypothetical protein
MNDPKRWSDDAAAGELERELLAAGQAVKMPDSERRALWASIALALPAALAPSSAAAARTASSAVTAYLTKGAIFLAAVGGLTFGAARLFSRPEPRPAERPLSVVTAAPRRAPSAPVALIAPVDAVAASEPAPSQPSASPPSSDARPHATPTSQLREESQAVLEARAALRGGDAPRCLRLLEQARERFPRGALGQEREALAIQALAQAGQTAAAKKRAAAFLRAHPQSPYSVDVQRVTER